MACKRISITNTKQESLLYNTLAKLAKNDPNIADDYYAWFQSDAFISQFGDWISDYKKPFAEREINQRHLDDNGEPLLIWNPKKGNYYFKDKYGNKVDYNPTGVQITDNFSNNDIREITKFLALDFLKDRIDANFNTLDLSARNTTLRNSIKAKLESKVQELVETGDLGKAIIATQLEETIAVTEQWVQEVEDFFAELKLNYKETSEQEDTLEEEESERGATFGKASFEKSTKDNISANVKLRLSLLVDIDNISDVWNEPTFIDFDEAYGTLLLQLTDKVAIHKAGQQEDLFDLYKDEVKKLVNKKPHFEDLYNMLNNKDLPDYVKAEFVQAFNLHRNNFIGTSYFINEVVNDETGEVTYETVSVVRNLSDVGSKSQHVKGNWQHNFKQKFMPEGKLTKEARESLNKQFKDYQDWLGRTWKKGLRNNLFNTEAKLEKAVKDMMSHLEDLGVEMTRQEMAHYLDGLDPMNLSLEERRNNLDKLANSLRFFYKAAADGSLMSQESSPLNNQREFVRLAKAKAFFMSQGTDASIYTTGKTKWIFSYPSYLSTKIKTWRKNPEALKALYDMNPINRSSHYMKYLLALDGDYVNATEISKQRLEEFDLNVFNSLQEQGGSAVDNKRISKNDTFADVFNKLLGFRKGTKSYVITPTPADKSTLYQLTVPKEVMVNSNAQYKDETVVVNEEAVDIVFDYVKSEYERIKTVQREIDAALENKDTSKLVLHYHFKYDADGNPDYTAGNGLKFQTFPSLNENLEGAILFDKAGRPLLNISLEIPSVMPKVKDLIRETISEDVILMGQKLVQMQLIQFDENGKHINKGFDTQIWDSYKEVKNPAVVIAADIYLNSLIAQVEYSKMFAGDVAYYKDNVDYKKRIPATYTDGLQLYLRPNDPQKYNSAVIQGVVVPEKYKKELQEVVGKDIADQYDDVNSTDAQAWITPARWKFLKQRLGKWAPIDDVIYEKLSNREPLEREELLRAAQPLKGVYFDINEGRPVYLKYSQAVLIPQLIAGTDLEMLSNKMAAKKIDEVVTVDGVKVGAFEPTNTHNPDGTMRDDFSLTPMPLNNSGWKLQQDLPTKMSKATDVGSQIQKIIFSGLSFNLQKDFVVGNNEMKGTDLINHINSIVGKLSDNGFDSVMREFGIGPDGKITNVARLNNAIIRELKSRGASRNVIRALENSVTPFAIPGYQEKIQNVFAAMVLKRVVKIKTNGGSFIQMSNYGLNKTEAENEGTMWAPWAKDTTHSYEYIKDENGEIVKSESGVPLIRPAGILLSGSFIAQHIPNYKEMTQAELFGTYNAKTRKYEGGAIDFEILNNIIGYRIPNQGLASNDALQVVGILPETSGDTVVAYTGITTKTGSDFDIDKMYLMMPSFVPARQNAKKIRTHVMNTLKGKSIQDTIDNIDAILAQLDPDEELVKIDANGLARMMFAKDKLPQLAFELDQLVEAILRSEQPLAQYIKENIPNYDRVTKLAYIQPAASVEEANTGQLQNMLIEAYKGVITHPDVIKSVMTPIDFIFFQRDIESMFPEEPAHDLQTFNIMEEIELRYRFMAGKAGVGQTANSLVDHVRGQMAELSLLEQYLGQGNSNAVGETKFDLEFSTELSDKDLSYYAKELGLSKAEAEKLRKVKIADSLSALMNAYVDIAKDPYITRGNWTTQTANVGFMLIRAGVHPFYVNAILAQPIIKEYSEFVANSESIVVNNSGNLVEKFITEKIIQDLDRRGEKVTINGITRSKARVYSIIKGNTKQTFPISNIFKVDEKKDPENFKKVQALVEDFKEIQATFNAANDYNFMERSLKELRENAVGDPAIQDQLAVLHQFEDLIQTSKKLTNNINASKADVTGYGKNVTDLLVNYNLINGLLDDVAEEGTLKGFDTKLWRDGKKTVLGTYINNSILRLKDIMQGNPLHFLAANEAVFNTFNEISKGIYGTNLTNQDLADKIHRSFYSYVMSGFPALQMSEAEKIDMIDNMAEELLKMKRKLKDNKFLQELDVKPGDMGRSFVAMSNRKKSPSLEADITNAWLELMESDEPAVAEFAEKLVKYSYLTSGFQLNLNQFYTYLPYEWFVKNKINDYIQQVAIDYSKNVLMDEGFLYDFFRHNMADSAIVPQVFKNQMGAFRKNHTSGFVLTKYKRTTRFVKVGFTIQNEITGEETTKYGLYELEGFNNDGDPVYIRKIPLGLRDKRGNKVYEYNRNLDLVPTIFPENKVKGLNNREFVRKQIAFEIDMEDALPVAEDNVTVTMEEAPVEQQPQVEEVQDQGLTAMEPLLLKVPYKSNIELANDENNPLEAKRKQMMVKKEADKLDELIRCIWKS